MIADFYRLRISPRGRQTAAGDALGDWPPAKNPLAAPLAALGPR